MSFGKCITHVLRDFLEESYSSNIGNEYIVLNTRSLEVFWEVHHTCFKGLFVLRDFLEQSYSCNIGNEKSYSYITGIKK